MVKKYFKEEWKGMLKALIVALIVAGIYLAYIYFIGRPITEARNIFNEGVRLSENGNYTEAHTKFEESNKIWWTQETQQNLDQTAIFLK